MPAAQVRLSAGGVPDSRPRLQRMEVSQIKAQGSLRLQTTGFGGSTRL
jgi:hypothetical protein